MRVWKNGAITGNGDRRSGRARCRRPGAAAGARPRPPAGRFAASGATVATDDRGVYRFSNLLPGDYLVIASPPVVSVKSTRLRRRRADRAAGSGELGVAAYARGVIPRSRAMPWLRVRPGAVFPPPPARWSSADLSDDVPSRRRLSSAQATTVTLGLGRGARVDRRAAGAGSGRAGVGPARRLVVRTRGQMRRCGLSPVGSRRRPLGPRWRAVSSTDSSRRRSRLPPSCPGQYTLRAERRVVQAAGRARLVLGRHAADGRGRRHRRRRR